MEKMTMTSIWDANFIVTDVETTGSHPEKNRITDIACVTLQNGEIVSSFSSLVNPHQFIPPYIVNMTGITNEMAFNAPEPEIVMPKAHNRVFSEGAVFVAHNVNFDWTFVSNSFKREMLGVDEDHPRLCTLKLARRLLPKNIKKNVGALAAYFGIKIKNRHRALGDAEATAIILSELCEIAEAEHGITTLEDLLAFQNKPIKNFKSLPPAMLRVEEKLAELPDASGVYYFLGKKGEILYVGKAKSLKERVKSYFTLGELPSKKVAELVKKIYDIKWETTFGELSALIKESREIKQHKPPFNYLEKRYRRYPFIRLSTNELFPKIDYTYTPEDPNAEYYGPFRNIWLVREILESIEKNFRLIKCAGNFKPSEDHKTCLFVQLDKCIAPCNSSIATADDYAEELNRVRAYLSGADGGIISKLEAKMNSLAEELEFEAAAEIKYKINELKKTLTRSPGAANQSLNSNNMIALLPNEEQDRTIDIFLIKSGKLMHESTFGKKSNITGIHNTIHDFYYNGSAAQGFSIQDVDEIKIVNSWMFRKQEEAKFIYMADKSEMELCNALETAISEFFPEEPHDYVFDDLDFFREKFNEFDDIAQ